MVTQMRSNNPQIHGHSAEEMRLAAYLTLTPDEAYQTTFGLGVRGTVLIDRLAICDAATEGFYLFSCDEQWNVVFDTNHDSLDAATRQLAYEFPQAVKRCIFIR